MIISLGIYFLLRVISDVSEEKRNVVFSLTTILVVFRSLEYIGNFVPGFGPYVSAFVSIFRTMFIYVGMIVILAMACSIGFSPFFCDVDSINPNITAAGEACSTYQTRNYDDLTYSSCIKGTFIHMFFTPIGGMWNKKYPLTPGNTPLDCYGEILVPLVVLVKSLYYVLTSFALLRGVLIKFLMMSKGDEAHRVDVLRATVYMNILFSDINHPMPWNLFLGIIEWILSLFGKSGKKKQTPDNDALL